MNQVPGTKPWLLGVGRMGSTLVPFINIGRLLAIPRALDDTQPVNSTALFVNGEHDVGVVAIVVDEVLVFFEAGELEDCDDPDFKIPPGLGACLRGTVSVNQGARAMSKKDGATYNRTWALIDLKALIADPKIQKIELN